MHLDQLITALQSDRQAVADTVASILRTAADTDPGQDPAGIRQPLARAIKVSDSPTAPWACSTPPGRSCPNWLASTVPLAPVLREFILRPGHPARPRCRPHDRLPAPRWRRTGSPPSRTNATPQGINARNRATGSSTNCYVFACSNVGEASKIWEPNWEPTATALRRRQAITSFHRRS